MSSFEERIRQQIINDAADRLDVIATQAVSDVQMLCPVDTGTLRRSITRSDVEVYGNEISVKIGSAVEYAPYVEYGHINGGTFVPGYHMFDTALTKAVNKLGN